MPGPNGGSGPLFPPAGVTPHLRLIDSQDMGARGDERLLELCVGLERWLEEGRPPADVRLRWALGESTFGLLVGGLRARCAGVRLLSRRG
jgi:hypothetical protein